MSNTKASNSHTPAFTDTPTPHIHPPHTPVVKEEFITLKVSWEYTEGTQRKRIKAINDVNILLIVKVSKKLK